MARPELSNYILESGAEFKYPPYNEFTRQLKSCGDAGVALLKLESQSAAECSEAISAALYNEATARRAADDCINVLRQEDVLEKIYELEQQEKRAAPGSSKSDIAVRMLELQRELIKLRRGKA
ncbi:hypothetical protein SDC9_166626 [bioreactor metagenome]|uniref:DNA primase n=1 Tax=bioreactor metagenome TaxID=1076179 RepID=A0A645G065_9ZZZZ